MIAFASRHFVLSAPADKDGTISYRETLENLLKRSKSPKNIAYYESELQCPPFPMALDYLWRVFQRLARRRTSNGFGSNPITWADIDAFVRHSKFKLSPWEIEVIEDLDDFDRNAQARAQSGNQSTQPVAGTD